MPRPRDNSSHEPRSTAGAHGTRAIGYVRVSTGEQAAQREQVSERSAAGNPEVKDGDRLSQPVLQDGFGECAVDCTEGTRGSQRDDGDQSGFLPVEPGPQPPDPRQREDGPHEEGPHVGPEPATLGGISHRILPSAPGDGRSRVRTRESVSV